MKIKLNIKPLSVNEAFKGRRFKTNKYKVFENSMMYSLPKLDTKPTFESVKIDFGFSSKLSDIDNPIKMVLDCLVKRYGVDDRNLQELHVTKKIVEKGCEYIEIELI